MSALLSLALGIVALVVPIMGMCLEDRDNIRKYLPILSFSACAAAVVLQIFEVKYRVELEDWTALMDLVGTMCGASVILVVMTVILNIFVLRKVGNK